ncbi:MAG TPA: hypothetical protein VGN63_19375 [Flavisolibacter sp.]|jgi:hypothetical protein|nr:hypothetical protein [Flavisolibacter sp.]
MERNEGLEVYIQKRLNELEKEMDMKEITTKGKLSFGVDSTSYAHLPAWKELVQQKKKLVRWIWVDAFFLSLTVVFIASDYADKFAENWLKAALSLLFISGMVLLFFVVTAYYSLFYRFRKTEREVRKLIYQDILFRLKNEQKEHV